jgi:hypothetical protein
MLRLVEGLSGGEMYSVLSMTTEALLGVSLAVVTQFFFEKTHGMKMSCYVISSLDYSLLH